MTKWEINKKERKKDGYDVMQARRKKNEIKKYFSHSCVCVCMAFAKEVTWNMLKSQLGECQ